jgi:hypothetical protein
MDKLTWSQKKLVLEALFYYRDDATQVGQEFCGLSKSRKRVMNQAIDKIQKLL